MLIRAGKRNPNLRAIALQIVSDVPGKNWKGEVVAIYEYVREHVTYRKDIHETETLQPPLYTLESGTGDCDDFTILICSLLASIGHPTKIVAVGKQPGEYSHVYCETQLGTVWVPIDGIMDYGVGWSAPGMVQRMEINN